MNFGTANSRTTTRKVRFGTAVYEARVNALKASSLLNSYRFISDTKFG